MGKQFWGKKNSFFSIINNKNIFKTGLASSGGLNQEVKTGFNCLGQNLQNGQNWVKLDFSFQYFVFHCCQLPQHIIHGVIMSLQSKCCNAMYNV